MPSLPLSHSQSAVYQDRSEKIGEEHGSRSAGTPSPICLTSPLPVCPRALNWGLRSFSVSCGSIKHIVLLFINLFYTGLGNKMSERDVRLVGAWWRIKSGCGHMEYNQCLWFQGFGGHSPPNEAVVLFLQTFFLVQSSFL